MTLPSVDFPAPFSPMRAWTSPARNVAETSSSACVTPKRLLMFSATRTTPPGWWLWAGSLLFLVGDCVLGWVMRVGSVSAEPFAPVFEVFVCVAFCDDVELCEDH